MADEIFTFSADAIDKIARHVRRLERQVQDLRKMVATQPTGDRGPDHYLVKPTNDIAPGEYGQVSVGRITSERTEPDVMGPLTEIHNHTLVTIPADIWTLAHKERGGCRFVPCEPGSHLFLFVLVADMSGGSADATIMDMEENVLHDGEAGDAKEVFDARGIFAALVTGGDGECIFQGGKYWIIQANCPG